MAAKKKTAAKKTPTKKTPAKKTPARKPAPKKPAQGRSATRKSAPERPGAAARRAPVPQQPAPPEAGAPTQQPPSPDVEDSFPEGEFLARVPPPEPERARPSQRRGIFFDVENTSRPSDAQRMIEQLMIDRTLHNTDFVAAGNWRVIGSETARLLARHGANLVHSAPATGVRDWSDLRIAVSAGIWLAQARHGDDLIIVSDDKAFDVVGDVAASLGVSFRRASFRAALRAAAAEAPARKSSPRRRRGQGPAAAGSASPASRPAAASGPRREPSERRRSAQTARPAQAPTAKSAEAEAAPETASESTSDQPPQHANHDEMLTVVLELLSTAPGGVSLDAVSNRLKALGFVRPPGSPRLVTRLRSFKELDVSARGHIKLKGGASSAQASERATEPSEAPEASEATAEGAASAAGEEGPSGRRRGRRRGGRSRGGRREGAGPSGGAEATEGEPQSEGQAD
jgi:hypothetical protein